MASHFSGILNNRRVVAYALLLGIASMLAGLFCVSVTIARNDYRVILRWGLLFAAVSALCYAVVFIRGSWRWRIAAAIAALPLIYVRAEIMRRGDLLPP